MTHPCVTIADFLANREDVAILKMEPVGLTFSHQVAGTLREAACDARSRPHFFFGFMVANLTETERSHLTDQGIRVSGLQGDLHVDRGGNAILRYRQTFLEPGDPGELEELFKLAAKEIGFLDFYFEALFNLDPSTLSPQAALLKQPMLGQA